MNQMEAGSFHAQVKSQGSSVDPQLKENNQPLQSAHGEGDALSGQKSPKSDKNKSEETGRKNDVPPERYLESGLWKAYCFCLSVVYCQLYCFFFF